MNTSNYPLTLLYDGNCPICNLEMDDLWARNSAGLLRFVDITAPGFDPTPYKATIAKMNALIHAQRPDGSLVIGVEVFRLVYALLARNRYIASRIAMLLITWIAARRAIKRSKACASGRCEINIERNGSCGAAATC